MTWSRPLSVWLAPALVLALGAVVILFDWGGLESALANRLFDTYQRHAAIRAGTTVKVLELPGMDEDSLVKTARMLAQMGVRLAVFTAPMVPGPSLQSLAAKLPPGSDAARAALAQLPEPGHDFAQALHGFKAVVPVTLGVEGRNPQIKARFVYRGSTDPFGQIAHFENASAPAALVEDNAAGSGAANLPADADGVVRRVGLAFRLDKGLVPGLGVEALRVDSHQAVITVQSDERNPLSFLRGVGIAALETSSATVPAGGDGTVWLRFAADASARAIDPENPDATPLKDAIVVVGAQGALAQTPMGPASIASITAQSIEDLMTGQVLTRPFWLRLVEALSVAVLGTLMVLTLRFGLGWTAALLFAALAGLGFGSWYLYAAQSMLADAATPALVLLLAFAAGAWALVADMRAAYAGLRQAFADSLPRATIEKIARRPELLKIEGENRDITYLVCGVRGQAGLAEAYKDNPQGFTSMMQTVLTPLIDQALAHGGTIDRLTADGFAAFWNAPLDDADHALHACEAANGMAIMSSRITDHLALDHRGDAAPTVEIGVGVATGPVVAGAFGGLGRLGYSVNGDCAVLAGRIQALSRLYGPALIVGGHAKRAAERGFAFLEIDTIADQNDKPLTLWAIMGNPVSRASPKFRALTVFHDHIFQAIRKQQWQMARELIAQCRRLSGASPKLYDLHLARIAWYERNPPGPDWDGAFRPVVN